MITRAKDGVVQPKGHPTLLLIELEPSTYKSALKNPKWFAAMKIEYDVLLANNTLTLTTLPSHRHSIGCKWVFRIKQNPYGSINKYKSRLVAKGFHQQKCFDFTETFSPVVKHVNVRIVLTFAITERWHITQLDVNKAFTC